MYLWDHQQTMKKILLKSILHKVSIYFRLEMEQMKKRKLLLANAYLGVKIIQNSFQLFQFFFRKFAKNFILIEIFVLVQVLSKWERHDLGSSKLLKHFKTQVLILIQIYEKLSKRNKKS